MREESDNLDRRIGRLAGRQYGNVTREQLRALSMSSSAIGRCVRKGQLIQQHQGVYRVGHAARSTKATYMAAVLAGGDRAHLFGRAAGHLMKLLKGPPPPPEVIVTTNRRIKGVRVRREANLHPRDATTWQGIPTTTVARTLVDLAAVLTEEELGRAVHQAMVLYRTPPRDVEAVLARRPRSKGAGHLRSILRGDTRITLSKLESHFLDVCKTHELELPTTNKRIGGRYVDCRWPHRKLTVELDSYRYHASRHAWEQDRKREREARARGDDFRRYTWDDVTGNVEPVVRELRPIIGL
jgi:hypothetical protein